MRHQEERNERKWRRGRRWGMKRGKERRKRERSALSFSNLGRNGFERGGAAATMRRRGPAHIDRTLRRKECRGRPPIHLAGGDHIQLHNGHIISDVERGTRTANLQDQRDPWQIDGIQDAYFCCCRGGCGGASIKDGVQERYEGRDKVDRKLGSRAQSTVIWQKRMKTKSNASMDK